MPIIKKSTTMTANGQAYPLQGSQYEFLPFDALVEFAILADTGGSCNATVHSGSDLLMEGAALAILAVANPILYPDHFDLQDVAMAGERLGVELTETGGGTPVIRTVVRITPQ